MEYLIILSIFLLSALYMENRFHIHLYRTRKERFIVAGMIFFLSLAWDYYATWGSYWSFNGPD